jgi:hypothetical protein
MKLGKLPKREDPRTIQLADILVPTVVPVFPIAADYTTGIKAWRMFKNDVWGCCVVAAIFHAIQIMTANSGNMLVATDDDVEVLYKILCPGFDPNAPLDANGNNPTDRGVVMLDAMVYWRNTGVMVNGTLHKIDAFVEIDASNTDEWRLSTHAFGCFLFGINLPKSAEKQFDAGLPWSIVQGSPSLGGHALVSAKYDPARFNPITWAKEEPADQTFVLANIDEAYAVLAGVDWADNSPSAIDKVALAAALKALA